MNYLQSYNIGFIYIGVYLFLINFSNICGQSESPSEYKIIISDDGLVTVFTLKRVENSFLANEELPLFETRFERSNLYRKLVDDMNFLGKITMYHNYEQLAAVVHTPLCDCLNGVIDSRYVIKQLPIAILNVIQEIGKSEYITRRSNIHTNHRPTEQALNGSMITKFEEQHESVLMNPIQMNRAIYPEVLVVLRKDFSSSFHADPYKVALHVISLLNAVDMLFSIAEHPHVKLNIAGIIIETSDHLQFISGTSKNEIDVKETVEKILSSGYTYFDKSKLQLNISFDYVLFITSNKLSFKTAGTTEELQRMAAYPKIGVHNATLAYCNFTKPILFATENNEFNSYATIAHDLFHLMSEGAHAGTTVSRDVEKKKCDYGYLDRYDTTIFESFKWSFDCCMLANKPQSLGISYPRMSLREQCKCYGFKPHVAAKNDECSESKLLYCEDELGGMQFNALIQGDTSCDIPKPEVLELTSAKESDVSWISPDDYKRLFYIFSGPKDHTQLTCYGMLIRESVIITAKDCIKESNEIENYQYSRYPKRFIKTSFNNNIKSTKDISDELALIFMNKANIRMRYLGVETELKTVEELRRIRMDACVLINMTSLNDGDMEVKYFPINITFDHGLIKSRDMIKPWKTKGNPLMCHIFENRGHTGRAALVGILVSDNGYYKFANLKDNLKYINSSL